MWINPITGELIVDENDEPISRKKLIPRNYPWNKIGS